ncbi:amidohydrolase family protein, partial [bacterium]|nr:amidohydrolase family protein [bacterium]
LFRKRIAKAENIEVMLHEAFSSFLKNGITSIDTMSHSENYHDLFTTLQKFDGRGELPIRIDVYFPDSMMDTLVRSGICSGFGSDYLKVGGVKIFTDGTLGSQTAHLLEPYCIDSNNYGISTITQEKLDYLIRTAAENNLKCAVHAIGDAAVRKTVEAFLKSGFDNSNNKADVSAYRHRIEHLQLIEPTDVPRLRKSGGAASVQPIHVSADIDIAKKYWGERCEFSYPYKTLLDAGIPLIFGSDAPIEDMNPMKGIYAAIARKSLYYRGGESFYPEQNLSRLQAVIAYTVTPHILKRNKKITGSIEVGKIADIVILSDNIFAIDEELIPEIKVDMTICGGKIVFER